MPFNYVKSHVFQFLCRKHMKYYKSNRIIKIIYIYFLVTKIIFIIAWVYDKYSQKTTKEINLDTTKEVPLNVYSLMFLLVFRYSWMRLLHHEIQIKVR